MDCAPALPSETLAARILASSPDGHIWLNEHGQVTWLNEATTRITGHQLGDCQGLADFPAPLVLDADRPLFEAMRARTKQTHGAAQCQVRLRTQPGAVAWVSMSWQPLRDASGQLQGCSVALRDTQLSAHTGSSPRDHLLTMRRQAARITVEAHARATDVRSLCGHIVERAAQVLGLTRVGTWLFDDERTELRCVDLYEAGEQTHSSGTAIPVAAYPNYMNAISTDELVVATDARSHPLTSELREHYLEPLGIASMLDAPIQKSGRTVGVLCMEHGPGQREWSAAEASFADALATFIGEYLEEQEREALQTLNKRLASIIETTPDMVFTCTLQGDLVYLNQAGREVLALSPTGSLLGLNAMNFVPPERLANRRDKIIPQALKQGSWQGEVEFLTSRGERIPASEYFVAHRDASGRVHHFSAVVRDLRAHKRAEQELRERSQALARLNDELEQRVAERTRRIEEINRNLETFAFSVSHDLKAPLRGIDGYSRLLMEDFRAELPTDAQGFLDNIRHAAQSMSELIDDLLAYSRVGRRELSPSRLPLRASIERVLNERAHDLSAHGVRLINEVEDVTLTLDLECLLQILRNLVDNAVKFSRQAHPPTITLRTTRGPQHITLSVKDNGCGFDMKYHDRIFAIFQRLHRATDYPGTGVGLAIVSKAAERLGGRVWARSQPNEGAEFFLELPIEALTP
jgi:PAS domain S-box-containing protein